MRSYSTDVSAQKLLELVEDTAAGPLPEEDRTKLRAAIERLNTVDELLGELGVTISQLRDLLLEQRTTEKTGKVLPESKAKTETARTESRTGKSKKKGHGRNGVIEYTAAAKGTVPHPAPRPKAHCPTCLKGKV